MASSKEIAVINVPEDIGSMIKGKSLAPEAIQAADLAGKLSTLEYDVEESSVLPDGLRT